MIIGAGACARAWAGVGAWTPTRTDESIHEVHALVAAYACTDSSAGELMVASCALKVATCHVHTGALKAATCHVHRGALKAATRHLHTGALMAAIRRKDTVRACVVEVHAP